MTRRRSRVRGLVQKFSANPAAVAYGNWQLAQSYQTDGNLEKALSFGDKALASAPTNLDILVSQANIASQMKSNAKVMDYATRGGRPTLQQVRLRRPAGLTDEQFASRVAEARESNKSSYEFLGNDRLQLPSPTRKMRRRV